MDVEPIKVRAIVEILGSPRDFVVNALKEHVAKLKADGTKVLSEKFEDPVEKDDLFNQFVELEIELPKVTDLLDFCFDSIPSSVEIMSPSSLKLEMAALEDVLNDFLGKLHHMDLMVKQVTGQKQLVDQNAVNICHNFILFVCKTPHSLAELSSVVGIKEQALTGFTNHLVETGRLKKEGDKFVTDD